MRTRIHYFVERECKRNICTPLASLQAKPCSKGGYIVTVAERNRVDGVGRIAHCRSDSREDVVIRRRAQPLQEVILSSGIVVSSRRRAPIVIAPASEQAFPVSGNDCASRPSLNEFIFT